MIVAMIAGFVGLWMQMMDILNSEYRTKALWYLLHGTILAVVFFFGLAGIQAAPVTQSILPLCVPGIYYLVRTQLVDNTKSSSSKRGSDFDWPDKGDC